MAPFAEGYVDVAERIREFKEKYPDGSLQSFMPPYLVDGAGKTFIVYSAAAYRTPDDTRPGIGWAWEPVPGPTPYTRDSELMNAETSAWGRAIVALGFETKKIASAEEVRNRQHQHVPQAGFVAPAPRASVPPGNANVPTDGGFVIPLGAHKGLTIAQVYDLPADASGKNDGAGYLSWAAFKMEPKAQSGKEFQEAAQRFLQAKKDAYDRSVLDPTGDPGPVEPGQLLDDDIPF